MTPDAPASLRQAAPLDVSVWVGRATSVAELEAALVPDGSCHGDSLGSDFSRAIDTPGAADAVRELRVLDSPTDDVAALLGPLSFARPLALALPPRLPAPCNAVVVFYGVRALGPAFELDGLRLEPLGVVRLVRLVRRRADGAAP
ncbi:MAG: hypothetical protein INH41_03925 [Myxococcaceae bacterium]|jgi:hypothetical protein|nr:hypothetical protein [Myxococcaceae bacterium]MCA3011529.1 hypothetical protein [Myxococcaceae bacterium]